MENLDPAKHKIALSWPTHRDIILKFSIISPWPYGLTKSFSNNVQSIDFTIKATQQIQMQLLPFSKLSTSLFRSVFKTSVSHQRWCVL